MKRPVPDVETGTKARPGETGQAAGLGLDQSGEDAVHQSDEREVRAAAEFAQGWIWVTPVAIAHVALVWAWLSAVLDFRLPDWMPTDRLIGWFWINGATIGFGAWFWRKRRFQTPEGKWLHGWRARVLILLWLALSVGWFLLPSLLQDARGRLLAALNSW